MTKSTLFILFCLISFSQTRAFAQIRPWKYRGEQGGLHGYTRYIPTGYELKFILKSASSKSAFAGVMNDVTNFSNWMGGLEQTETIQRKDNLMDVYFRAVVPFPWPMTPRDAIMLGRVWQEPTSKTLYATVRPTPAFVPPRKGFIRMKTFEMDVAVRTQKDKTNELECVMRLGSADGVPMWIVDWLATDHFYKIVHNFNTQTKLPVYRDFKHPSVTD